MHTLPPRCLLPALLSLSRRVAGSPRPAVRGSAGSWGPPPTLAPSSPGRRPVHPRPPPVLLPPSPVLRSNAAGGSGLGVVFLRFLGSGRVWQGLSGLLWPMCGFVWPMQWVFCVFRGLVRRFFPGLGLGLCSTALSGIGHCSGFSLFSPVGMCAVCS
jgi:hypothetical protein